ncbi:MAG: hypothetical protein HFH85_06305 [Lachnospiraceae bacterium]|nr:hypothetical protein [Lachnospiraceae bacterium]
MDSDGEEQAADVDEYISGVEKMAESALRNKYGVSSDPVWVIVSEEAGMYFAGDATLDGRRFRPGCSCFWMNYKKHIL